MQNIILLIAIMILSALPLNIAAKMLGGHSSILKVIGINIISAVIAFFLADYLGRFSAIILFIILLFIYKAMFDVGWIRALIIWILQFVILGLLIFVLITLGFTLSFI